MTVIETLRPHSRDLGGGFMVRRVLPAAARKSIGPFVFFDHFGPVTVRPQDNFDVRPHPHIGLATVTYLFEGAMLHRDSLGSVQRIDPGAINWMTAGRGIVHSERAPAAMKVAPYTDHGLQLWAALPQALEETEPAFFHTDAQAIPQLRQDDATVRVLIGTAWGAKSPVATHADTLFLDLQLAAQGSVALPALTAEMAVYPINGDLLIDGQIAARHTMALLDGRAIHAIEARTAQAQTRFVVIGGAPLDGPRHIWWNFVSSSKQRIVQASADWLADQMGRVPGDDERIPLPEVRFKLD